MSYGPQKAEGKNMCGAVATLKGGYMDGACGAKLPGRSGTYSRAGSDWRRSLLAFLCTQRQAILMDRLDRRGGLFLNRASAAFGDGERSGSGELPEDNSSSAGRSMSSGIAASLPLSGRDGGSGRGGPRDFSIWLASNRVRRRSLSSSNWFACSRNSAIYMACSSCLTSISWRQRTNWSSGGWFAGLLDMTVSSDGPMGCSGMAKASKIGRSPGSGCVPKLSRIASEISCSAFPTDGSSCSLWNSQSQRIVGAFTRWLQPAKQTRR